MQKTDARKSTPAEDFQFIAGLYRNHDAAVADHDRLMREGDPYRAVASLGVVATFRTMLRKNGAPVFPMANTNAERATVMLELQQIYEFGGCSPQFIAEIWAAYPHEPVGDDEASPADDRRGERVIAARRAVAEAVTELEAAVREESS